MFGKEKPAPQKRIDSLVGAGTTVRGDLVFAGGLRIDGEVYGNVLAADGKPATLVLSEKARVDGRIDVSHVVVNGTVNGPVVARDYLELQPKSRIAGDVAYRTLEMHVGAIVQGRLEHVPGGEPGAAAVVELKRGGSASQGLAPVAAAGTGAAPFDGSKAQGR